MGDIHTFVRNVIVIMRNKRLLGILFLMFITLGTHTFYHEQTHAQIYSFYGCDPTIHWGILKSYVTAEDCHYTTEIINMQLYAEIIGYHSLVVVIAGFFIVMVLVGTRDENH